MKILFLDIDGVLNTNEWLNRTSINLLDFSAKRIDPNLVKKLNFILEETGASVVISSSWRIALSRREIEDILKKCGFTGCIQDVTPRLQKARSNRADEITEWLTINHLRFTDRFVVLDDGEDFEFLERFLIKTNSDIGLTDENADAAISILNS